ncbi:Hypothetical predicted protein [Podarcis lilfordi]|uniref:Uncharacterized protein n=1 Tax=Podarcis lilfordi TaxID=74358 RepID=A0AA35LER4_9SAUR|nr:Hypothetical predicted protein [Podarcis lilfordi]
MLRESRRELHFAAALPRLFKLHSSYSPRISSVVFRIVEDCLWIHVRAIRSTSAKRPRGLWRPGWTSAIFGTTFVTLAVLP